MSAVAFDPYGFSIPGERAGWCLDCGTFFYLAAGHCTRCGAETFVSALKFMNALVAASATPVHQKTKAPVAQTTEA